MTVLKIVKMFISARTSRQIRQGWVGSFKVYWMVSAFIHSFIKPVFIIFSVLDTGNIVNTIETHTMPSWSLVTCEEANNN